MATKRKAIRRTRRVTAQAWLLALSFGASVTCAATLLLFGITQPLITPEMMIIGAGATQVSTFGLAVLILLFR